MIARFWLNRYNVDTKVYKRSCRWQVFCIPKYAREAASGRFSVLKK